MHTIKTIITILFLAIANIALAQKEPIPYEWFEEKSKTISDLQEKVTGLKDNFKVNYYDKLASYSMKVETTEANSVAITEDIDFSKATGLYLDKKGTVYAHFPENSLSLQIYINGKSQIGKYNDIGFLTNSAEDQEKMFKTVYELITFLKIDKGLLSSNDAEQHWQDWQNLKIEDFYIKYYPKSILAYENNDNALLKVGSSSYNKENYTEALKWFERSANLGNGYANYMSGHLYFSGRGVVQDRGNAFKYWLKGAEQGDVNALNSAGQSYYYGWGTQANEEKARIFFKQAINKGSTKARENLYNSFKYGLQSKATKIIECYQNSSATIGSLEGKEMELLGMAYYYNKEYEKSLEWLKKACDKGERSSDIGTTIREIYSKGLGGVVKDRKAGRYWEDKCY